MRNTRIFCYLDGDAVWEYLETGKDIDELYPEEFKEEIQLERMHKVASRLLLEGEEIYIFPIDGRNKDYAVTSFGRAFNLRTGKTLSANMRFTTQDIYFYIREQKQLIKNIFIKNGWDYDLKKIYQVYMSQGKHIYLNGVKKDIFNGNI